MVNLYFRKIPWENSCINSSVYCKVTNKGMFVAAFSITFYIGTSGHTLISPSITHGHSQIITFPTNATNITIKVVNKSFIHSPVICSKNLPTASSVCFILQGTEESPICNEVPCNSIGNVPSLYMHMNCK